MAQDDADIRPPRYFAGRDNLVRPSLRAGPLFTRCERHEAPAAVVIILRGHGVASPASRWLIAATVAAWNFSRAALLGISTHGEYSPLPVVGSLRCRPSASSCGLLGSPIQRLPLLSW